ncbi:MAG: ATP-binding protein [Rubrobacter sp.]
MDQGLGKVSGMDAKENGTFGGMLKRLREAAGLTQEELALRAGMTAKGVSALERGERKRPYPHTVRSISEALGLPEEARVTLFAAVPRRNAKEPDPTASVAPEPDVAGSGLPAPTTPLVGREKELVEVTDLLGRPGTRLLTLTGVGGTGKTRLALEAARWAKQRVEQTFPDGVAFAALASLGDAALVASTISQALGLQETAARSPLDAVREHLRERRMLLVLDNFEHVAGAAPDAVALIEGCPDLTVLVTSRAPLRVRGEQEYPVQPLALPASTVSSSPGDVLDSPSGRLFVERARAASPSFEVTEENARAVAAICWRLDGIPLALELAAAKARHLDPAALLGRLDRALSRGWARDLPERQQTMRAALDWSHDLLSDEEKVLFRRLSVFAGGFTLEAAEEVGANGEDGADDVVDLLGRLVEQSLVLAETPAGEMRYRMLEPVRQYALEELKESGEADQVLGRHAGHYLALAELAGPQIKGWDQGEWLDRLETESDNLRAAISRSAEAGDIETASRICWSIGMYWVMRARHSEGLRLMEQVLAHAEDMPAGQRVRILWPMTVCIYGSRDNERLMVLSEEAVALARQAGDAHAEANMLGMAGFAALQLGDLDRAAGLLEESLALCRERELDWEAAQILTHLAVPPMRRGEYERAAGYAREALVITERIGDRLAGNIAIQMLAQAAWAAGDGEGATRYFRHSLELAYELADRVNSAYCLRALATVEETRDEPRHTARMLGAAEALLEAAGVPTYAMSDHEFHLDAEKAVREELGQEAWLTARDEGREMTFDQAVAYALEVDG